MNYTLTSYHRFVCFCAACSIAAGVMAQAKAPPSADAPAKTGAAKSDVAHDVAHEGAKPETLPALAGRPDPEGEDLLGGNYQNPLAGIAFRTPVNCTQVKITGDEIVRLVNEKRNWELVCTRSSSAQPLPLSTGQAKGKMGLLEVVAARLKQANPAIEIVRQDTATLGDYEAGMIVARFTTGTQRHLIQEAMIQANDQLYYLLTMTSPAAKESAGSDSTDPGEKIAADTFRQMLDSVKLLDRGVVKDDQNERLYRTRALLVNLTPKRIQEVLVPESWLRLQRDGKDIGYTYIVEEQDNKAGNEGIKIGIRSRSYPDQSTQVDSETWNYVTSDRKHESWSNLAWVQDHSKKKSDQMTEFGSSDRRINRALDESGQIQLGDKNDPKQPPVRMSESYVLNAQSIGKSASADPITRTLPPFYLPQAIGHLLPRLVPLREPKTFLFATYVGERREVMMRYVDVGAEQEVDLDGKRVQAIPVSDRIGLEGSPTIHYISPDGKYLGSVNRDSKITILPTDAATLQKIWANKADLTRPRAVEPPKS